MSDSPATRVAARRRFVGGPFAFVAVAGMGAVLLVGPSIGGHSLVPPCPFRALTGWDCPFCGGTRAVRSLLAGDLGGALDFNAVVTAGMLTAVLAALWWVAAAVLPRVRVGPLSRVLHQRWVLPAALGLLAVFWVVRNLPFVPYLGSST